MATRLLLVVFMIGVSLLGGWGVNAENSTTAPQLCQQVRSGADVVAQRGCCSYHSGVCGCVVVYVQCCDGTMSPSCRC